MDQKTKEYALLAVLDAHPMHGYALAAYFSASFGAFLGLNKSAIYAALRRFEAKHWVDVQSESTGNYPERKILSLSGAGRAALAEFRRAGKGATISLPDLAMLIDGTYNRAELEARLLEKRRRLSEFDAANAGHEGHPATQYTRAMMVADIAAFEALIEAAKG